MYMHIDNEYRTTCYTTTLTKGLNAKTQEIASTIKQMLMLDSASFTTAQNGVIVARMERENLPYFDHPIIHDGQAFIDARKYHGKDGMLKTSSVGNYNFMLKRAALDLQWTINKAPFDIFVDYAAESFGTWYSNSICGRLGLDLDLNMKLKILGAVYYIGLFHTNKEVPDDDVIAFLLRKIPKIFSFIPVEYVKRFIDEYEGSFIGIYRVVSPYDTGNMFSILTSTTNDVIDQKEAVNFHMLLNTLCKGAFVDLDPVALAAIALEHPPTFISMMNAILLGGVQSQTSLGKIVDKNKKNYDINNFNVAYKRLTGM